MPGRSIFVLGMVQDPFRSTFTLSQSSFESLSPEKKAEFVENRLDQVFRLHGKVMEAVMKFGGLGERLKMHLGPDYDTFVITFYGQSGLGEKARRLYEVIDNPEMAVRLDARDEESINQWGKAVLIMDEILTRHNPEMASSSSFPTPTALVVGGLAAAGLVAFLALG